MKNLRLNVDITERFPMSNTHKRDCLVYSKLCDSLPHFSFCYCCHVDDIGPNDCLQQKTATFFYWLKMGRNNDIFNETNPQIQTKTKIIAKNKKCRIIILLY